MKSSSGLLLEFAMYLRGLDASDLPVLELITYIESGAASLSEVKEVLGGTILLDKFEEFVYELL